MPRRFSKQYVTYRDWSTKARASTYTKEIKRLHALHPKATLTQLRRHPGARERPLGTLERAKTPNLPVIALTPRERAVREKSLKVLSQMRKRGYSLTKASREVRINPKTVIRNTGAFRKVQGRWRPNRHDHISRRMNINENGSNLWIDVANSRHASTIGRYHSAIGEFLQTGDASVLTPFKGKRVRDAQGNWHTLETDPDAIYEIMERREEEEFYSVYKW